MMNLVSKGWKLLFRYLYIEEYLNLTDVKENMIKNYFVIFFLNVFLKIY